MCMECVRDILIDSEVGNKKINVIIDVVFLSNIHSMASPYI